MGVWSWTGRVWLPALLVAVLVGALPGVASAASAASITSYEGQVFTGVVDTVSCASAGRIVNPMIDWGDNTAASAGTVQLTAPNTCTITGTHTYDEEGSYATHVSYTSSGSFSDTGSATVIDTAPSAYDGGTFTGAIGHPVGGVVATFLDIVSEPVSNYSATIDWGDGQTTPGTVTSGFSVSGSHAYTYGGTYRITVTIHDEGGADSTAHSTAAIAGCPGAAPTSPAPSFSPPANGLNSRFVQALYHDLLGRPPDQIELAAGVQALSQGASREQLAASFLDSAAYRQDLVEETYSAFLGHPPDAQATSTLVGLLNLGSSDEAMAAQILGSGDYFAGPGDNSTEGFLGALYCQTVFRPIDGPTESSDEILLGVNTSRAGIATKVLASTEYLAQRVQSYYLRFLRKAAAPSELAYWAGAIQQGATDEQAIATILGSQEYYELFNPIVKAATTASAKGTLSTTISSRAKLTLTVLRIVPSANDAAVSQIAPRTQRVGVVNFGIHRKGRVKLHWNRKVRGRRLRPGSYLLLLRAYHGRRLIYISDAVPFKVR